MEELKDMVNVGYKKDVIEYENNLFINEETYTGPDYQIAARIQRLRLNLLIHSRIYYLLDENLISDAEWDKLAYELKDLQAKYPGASNLVPIYLHAFKDWDATTGAFLPLYDPWVVRKTNQLLKIRRDL